MVGAGSGWHQTLCSRQFAPSRSRISSLRLGSPNQLRRSSEAGRRGVGTRIAGEDMSGAAVGDFSSPAVASNDAAGESAASTKTVSVIIKGKVQGVYYRDWTVSTARQLGVDGWVRNLKDGSVEAVFSGKSPVVDSLIEKCHVGPSAARVSGVEVSDCNDRVPQGFERKPTA